MSHTPSAIVWLEWDRAVFARAVREDKPILLSLVAPWCEHCAVMDRATYARVDIAHLVATLFVPVRVNTDRRPDINERYNLGGWPTTAFLTPDGEILGGGTFIDANDMSTVLTSVAEAFVRRRPEIEARTVEARAQRVVRDGTRHADRCGAPRGEDAREDPIEWLSARLLELFDVEYGGFGERPKFPHVPALMLALARHHDTGDSRFARIVTTSLDGLARLHDEIEGGFFRYAAHRDWSGPHTEKVLSDNALLIRLHLDAGTQFQRDDYIERAERALRWVHQTLADAQEGGFAASQAADAAYYRLDSAEARASRVTPRVDRTHYADSNAEMASTYLRAAEIMGEQRLREFAVRSLERTVLNTYQPGAGIAHVSAPDPDIRGLLADQVSIADALLRAQVVTGRLPYSMLAAELMESAIRSIWDDDREAFRDRADSDQEGVCGLLSRPFSPFALNCDSARVLSRLAIVTGRSSYRERAQATLSGLGDLYRDDPLLGASYGLAVREVRDGQLPSGLSLSYVDWKLGEPDDD